MRFIDRLKRTLRQRYLSSRTPVEIFSSYAHKNKWGDKHSLSGKGSNLEATANLREVLPAILSDLDAQTFLDLPCGDFFWMGHVDLSGVHYLGGDIVPELIEKNIKLYSAPNIKFQVIDLIRGPIPKADIVFIRDCFVHLSNDHIKAALRNIVRSDSKWLLTTTFPKTEENFDILTGEWRALDLCKPPFSFQEPINLIMEGQSHVKGQRVDKMIGLWKVSDINT